MDVSAYLARIGYSQPIRADLDTLKGLHRAHMLRVPFENLDIALGRKITCDQSRFLYKIVEEKRGGFCYEMNGAFAALLRSIGFSVELLSAKFLGADGSFGPEFDHLTLRVNLEEPWLADVGFGDGFVEPLHLRAGEVQPQDVGSFRVMELPDGALTVERQQDGGAWNHGYGFTLTARNLEDFAERCRYHQTSPNSHFTEKNLCTLALPDGRVTLSGMTLITTQRGLRKERELGSQEEWQRTLREEFGVVLPLELDSAE